MRQAVAQVSPLLIPSQRCSHSPPSSVTTSGHLTVTLLCTVSYRIERGPAQNSPAVLPRPIKACVEGLAVRVSCWHESFAVFPLATCHPGTFQRPVLCPPSDSFPLPTNA